MGGEQVAFRVGLLLSVLVLVGAGEGLGGEEMAKASPQRLQVVASFETKEPQCGQRSGIFSLSFARSMPGCGRTLAGKRPLALQLVPP